MTELMEKYNSWVEKVKAGEKDMLMLARVEKNWFLVGNRAAERVRTFSVTLDDGTGLHPAYIYSAEYPDVACPYVGIIIKDDKKMIIQGQDALYAFGVKDVPPPVRAMCIYLRTENLHSFVFFSNEAKSIDVVHTVVAGPRDAITCYMANMFGISAVKAENEEGGEGNG